MLLENLELAQLDLSAVISLIGSMGSSGAAVFVMWFLTSNFARSSQDERAAFAKAITDQNGRIYDMAKDSMSVVRDNAVAMSKLADAIADIHEAIAQLAARIPLMPPVPIPGNDRGNR